MLRKDTNATFEKSGASIFSRYRFVAGRVEAKRTLNRAAYVGLARRQQDEPQLVLENETRRWWLFRDAFYFDDEGYSSLEVKALLLERLEKRDRRVRRAVALMEQTASIAAPPREAIADEVKAFVWNRDGGCCTSCGGRERLEFDHIIPLSMGGGNTARNLQLLCETCNRVKGGSL